MASSRANGKELTMKLLGRIEASIEGFLRRCAGSSGQRCIQPVEIGKHLAKIMLADRRVSTVDVYVPNQFVVFLSSKDWEKLRPLCITITSDLVEYLSSRARRHSVRFAAPVQIEFRVEDSLPPGALRAEGEFREWDAPQSLGEARDNVQVLIDKEEGGSADGTQVYKLPEATYESEEPAQVVALNGPHRGEHWGLGAEPVSLGRGPDQHIQLQDPSVSRYHAVIRLTQGKHWIEDSHSTNGLRVNGNLVKKALLEDGDLLQLGNTRLQFRVVK